MNKKFVYQVINNKKSCTTMHGQPNIKNIHKFSPYLTQDKIRLLYKGNICILS